MKKLALLAAIMTSSFSTLADSKTEFQTELKAKLTQQGSVQGMHNLPLRSVQFVYTDDGNGYAVSGNGRFVFIGQVIDLWQQKEIKTLADAMNTKRVPLAQIGYKKENMAVWNLGNKDIPVQGQIFVSPGCPYCKKLLSFIDENKDDYHFEIILTPNGTGDPELAQETRRLWCAEDQEVAINDLIKGTSLADTERKDCDWKKVISAGLFFQAVEGQGVPIMFRADGLRRDGLVNGKSMKEQLDHFINRS